MLSKKNKNGVLQKIISAFSKNKKLRIAFYVLCAALIALLYFAGGESKNAQTVNIISPTEKDTEQRLSEVLSEIRGAGRVKVMITYDTTEEIVPAMSSSRQESSSQGSGQSNNTESEQNQLATVNKGGEQSPVVLKQIQPKVRGVIIIAEGAADISVKLALEYAASTVLGVDADNIEVFEMKAE